MRCGVWCAVTCAACGEVCVAVGRCCGVCVFVQFHFKTVRVFYQPKSIPM